MLIANLRPISSRFSIEKWQSLFEPAVGPQNEHSRVYEFWMLNSRKTTTRPVDSFDFAIPKEELPKSKSSQFLWKIHGKTFSFKVRFDKFVLPDKTLFLKSVAVLFYSA
jgi:hypothetical protein